MEIITIKEFLILIFQMIFLSSSIFLLYISIFKNSILFPNKSKFIVIKIKEYLKILKIIYLIIGLLGVIIAILSLTLVIGLNTTGILWGILILSWTYCDYYISQKYLLPINHR